MPTDTEEHPRQRFEAPTPREIAAVDIINRCHKLGDLVPDDLRTALIDRRWAQTKADRLAADLADAERDEAGALAVADFDRLPGASALVIALQRAVSLVVVPDLDPAIVGGALGAVDGQLAQAAFECRLPELAYEVDLQLYRDLAPHLLRNATPPVLTDGERDIQRARVHAVGKDTDWLAGFAAWRDVVGRQPDDGLILLESAQGLLQQASDLVGNRNFVAREIERVNHERERDGHTWRHPVNNLTQRQLLGITN
jgi:hypothetical protein